MKELDELIEKYRKIIIVLTENRNNKILGDKYPYDLDISNNRKYLKDLKQLKEKLKEQHKKDLIEFHVSVMEKGLESEASEHKKSEWDGLVRHQAEQYYNENFKRATK